MTASETVSAVAAAVQALSVVATAAIAIRGFSAWRRQLLGGRRIDLAGEILEATYVVQANLAFIRNGFGFGGEGKSRPRRDDEPNKHTDTRDQYFIPVERMKAHEDDLARFAKMKGRAWAYFGVNAGAPFDVILRAHNKVAGASRILMASAGDDGYPTKLRAQMEGRIWATGDEDDEVVREVAAAVSEIERLCRPLLQSHGSQSGSRFWQRQRK